MYIFIPYTYVSLYRTRRKSEWCVVLSKIIKGNSNYLRVFSPRPGTANRSAPASTTGTDAHRPWGLLPQVNDDCLKIEHLLKDWAM